MKKIFAGGAARKMLASVIAIICGLVFGLVIMYAFHPSNALKAFGILISGGASNGAKGIGQVIYYTAPYIMVGLSVAFSFQTGVFNIGAGGQFTVGSLAAILVAGLGTGIPDSIRWVVALLAAGAAGMIWAMVPGLMKAFFHCDEIITGIMMNYVAIYLCNQIVRQTYYDKALVTSKYVPESSLIPKMGLDKLFPGSNACGGIFIAIAFCIIIAVMLYRTSFGFGLRASGFNANASKYAGINDTRNILLVLLIAGLIAGIGGGILHLSSITKTFKIQEATMPEAGYGIPIALLACIHPIGVIFASLFLAWVTIGGNLMQGAGFPVETVEMITAIIIYFSAFSLIFRQMLERMLIQRSAKKRKENTPCK